MRTSVDNYYSRWRDLNVAKLVLHDASVAPPESLLQLIWSQQRLRRDALRTLDGRTLRVLHPGFANVSGGPDFHSAVLRIGNEPPVTGAVEIDVSDNGWRAHGHDRNPAFKDVVLHVIWNHSARPMHPATLVMCDLLDAPLTDLSQQLQGVSVRSLPDELRGKCCAPLGQLSAASLQSLLLQAALVRLHNKAHAFLSRAQLGGWDQSLWEGLFRALGYRHNTWPMQLLAESRSLWSSGCENALHVQARLLGLSGLLPSEAKGKDSSGHKYLLQLWSIWWRERERFSDCILPKTLWRFHGLRPANHPHRRLALAAQWSLRVQLGKDLSDWSQQAITDDELLVSLHSKLEVNEDPFWSWHGSLRSKPENKAQPLLGLQRLTDLAVNVVLPWLLARALAGKNRRLIAEIERRYLVWPAAEDNSVLRLARQRLLGKPVGRCRSKTAAQQQGLLQIAGDFCAKSTATCEGCLFPDLVKQWEMQGPQ